MKAGHFTDEQIVAVLHEAAKGEKPVVEFCREKDISEATFYAWRKKFGGMRRCATRNACANWKRRTRA